MQREMRSAVKSVAVRCIRAVCTVIKKLLAPETATTLSGVARDATLSKSELIAENAILRLQLIVASRSIKRPSLHDSDRLLMVMLARLNRAWRSALHLIQPDTLLRWHRDDEGRHDTAARTSRR